MANIPISTYRGDSDYIASIPNTDGNLLFDTDKKEIFMDNGTTRESYGGGAGDKVYATKAEAIADLANISDTDTVFVKEGTSTDMQTITYATWLTYSDAQKEAFNGYITNFPNEAMNASAVTYDNTDSGLTADNVQEAIDELNTDLSYNTADLLATSTMGSSGDKTLAHPISDYKFISIQSSIDNSYWDICEMSVATYKLTSQSNQIVTGFNANGGGLSYYVDDNTIYVARRSGVDVAFKIYGIK